MDRLAAARLSELRHQAAQERLAQEVSPPTRGQHHQVGRRFKLRLGAFLVGAGQRLLISSTPKSHLA